MAATTALVALLALTSCSDADGASAGTIAFLLPESKTTRYESIDRPMFESVVSQRCPDCTVLYSNANQDPERQQVQAEAALAHGATVLVLDAVDTATAQSILASARARGVAVVAYDRFLAGADYYVSFDSRRIGQMQGEALVRALRNNGVTEGHILVVNGAATDPNSAELREGLALALENSDLTILAEYSTPDWSPDSAHEWVSGQLTRFEGDVDGVYAANDGTAGGAITAMRAAGLSPIPPVTGQDAELAAVQRIVTGDQYMTVYKAISQQAWTAAELAVRLVQGETPVATATVRGVPAMLLTPMAVTRETIQGVLIAGGVFTAAQICVQPFTQACIDAGLLDPAEN
ncbi:D-xylose transport system substrate-binding protein [Sanguibacter gelidistatuariae]|uniref:D-xylose transport system substrate-binding protein n=1 Tax=Sanguibacter gelidistatuariae TaxID=1814289 RepID=A0A1G6KWC9_9MICO|nr:substrate-binding domain-containing protein [Sanguibacter gelidistatuariae]SDC35390.1 D-xylose transport system substrate-binding protein [Sanguibacter gelidistatuariae]